MRFRVGAKYIPLLASAGVLVLLYGIGCCVFSDRGFTELSVITNLFRSNVVLGTAAIGVTVVILSGGIDLSSGGIVAMTSMLVATLVFDPALDPRFDGAVAGWLPHGLHPLIAIGIALAVGTALGGAMGCLIHVFRLPPFLVTLGGMFFARGMAFTMRAKSLAIKHPFYLETVRNDLTIMLTSEAEIPLVVICFGLLFAAGLFVLHFTRLGRNVYAIGGSEESAVLMGLPVGRSKILIYTFAGFCSAVAGVLYTLTTTTGDPLEAGQGLELDAIASVVIGGTLLSGGIGFLAGTLIGVLIFGLIQVWIIKASLDESWGRIAIGVLMLLFILLQNAITAATRRRARQ